MRASAGSTMKASVADAARATCPGRRVCLRGAAMAAVDSVCAPGCMQAPGQHGTQPAQADDSELRDLVLVGGPVIKPLAWRGL